eukprot:Seg2753.1 transcript_id=Seg2753.1/GoldUCD/mRNA.D3Y31 product=Ankycorbin protein_id=Seg2753.1/GoldUCD/D3Y31
MKAPSTVYDIFVNTPSSVYSLKQIPVETTIYRLKSIIELRTGIPAEHQLLNLSGTALFDEFTLVDAGIRKGSVVRMLFATKVAEKLFDLANKDDISGLLNVGIQMIELSEASNVEEEKKLKAWNRNVMQRSFLAVCVACFNGSMQLLANLLKSSAFDANQVTLFGRSALHFAAARGSIGCVCLLLERGTDPFIMDKDGKTGQEIAADNGHVHCKRRIWLYRCNLKPMQTRNVGRKSQEGKSPSTFRLPILDQTNTSPIISTAETMGQLSREGTDEFPKVNLKKSEQRTSSGQNWRLDSLHMTERSDTMGEPVRYQTEASNLHERFLASAATNQQGAESEELKLLLQLAQKYGYVITEQSETQKHGAEILEKQLTDDEATTATGIKTRDNVTQISKAPSEEAQNENKRRSSVANSVRRISLAAKRSNHRPLDRTTSINHRPVDTQCQNEQTMSDTDGGKTDVTTEVVVRDSRINLARGRAESSETSLTGYLGETESIAELTLRGDKSQNRNVEQANDNEQNDGKDSQELQRLDKLGNVSIAFSSPRSSSSRSNRQDSKSTFQEWLERKSKQKRESMKDESNDHTEGVKRRDLSEKAFNNWLSLKRVRYRSASVSPRTVTHGSPRQESPRQESLRPKSGLSFENWRQRKGKVIPRSQSVVETVTFMPIKRTYSSGVTYAEWVESKKRQFNNGGSNNEKDKIGLSRSNSRLNGMSFDTWVEEKNKQFQIEQVQQATAKLQAEYEKEMELEMKLKNPKVKTFEDWQLEKKFEDRVKKAKEEKEKKNIRKKKVKFVEDSKLVYNMWLMNKHLNEIQEEQQQLTDAREEWERKKKEQLEMSHRRRFKSKSL